jgi:hypothetical protein
LYVFDVFDVFDVFLITRLMLYFFSPFRPLHLKALNPLYSSPDRPEHA